MNADNNVWSAIFSLKKEAAAEASRERADRKIRSRQAKHYGEKKSQQSIKQGSLP